MEVFSQLSNLNVEKINIIQRLEKLELEKN